MIIGPTTMTRKLCGRLLAICAVCISVAVVTISLSLSAHDSGAADALMLRLMSTHNGPGAALALIKNGSIVLEKGYGFRDLAAHGWQSCIAQRSRWGGLETGRSCREPALCAWLAHR